MLQASGGSDDHLVKLEEEEPDSSSQEMAVTGTYAPPPAPPAASSRIEFHLGACEQHELKNQESKKIAFTHQPQFLHVPAYVLDQTATNRGVPFVSALATQDFLQPLERGSCRENVSGASMLQPCCPGDVPLQLVSRESPADQLANKESRMQLQNLRMQYGYIDNNHVPKTGLEQSQQSGSTNRHWQQGAQINPNVNKRPRSAQSEGDETDVDERRKVPREGTSRDDANSRSVDVKASTSRSKHSATEQRRRSKINDRFQMLRDLLPHGDQKRDKASFLLEVIEYIQTLQERVKRYESLEKGRHGNKAMTWEADTSTSLKETSAAGTTTNRDKASFPLACATQGRGYGPAPPRLQGSLLNSSSHAQRSRQNQAAPVVEDLTREDSPMKGNASTSTSSQVETRNDEGNIGRQVPGETGSPFKTKNGQQKLPIKQGTISLSTAYSQGLLEALTSALQSSGLDLSKANISVQIELGKTPETKGTGPDTSAQ